MSTKPSLKEMLEAGVHFGHETKRWNPKMASYIFSSKEKIHIIDLEKTEKALAEAVEFVRELGQKNGRIIFLATKKQATEIVKSEAERVGAMYLTTRWLGGLFTNFESVAKTLQKLTELEEKSKDDKYTKREQLMMLKEAEKLTRYIGGVRNMETLPDAIFIVDSRKEENAVAEARKMGVPIVALVDTNADPTKIDFPIPSNDDAIKAINLMVKTIANAYEEGKNLGSKVEKKVEEVAEEVKEVIAEETENKEKKTTKKAAKKTEEKAATKKTTKSKKETK